jgi:hypothetical protein
VPFSKIEKPLRGIFLSCRSFSFGPLNRKRYIRVSTIMGACFERMIWIVWDAMKKVDCVG